MHSANKTPERAALIIVDVQQDFCPGGALAVPQGDEVVPVINRLQPSFELVVATQDWHPADHCSFAANHPGRQVGEVIEVGGVPQILWPVHCVQGSQGAEFHPSLQTQRIAAVFQKGTDPGIDSYSGFFDNARRRATGLDEFLRQQGVGRIFVCGLATDYCVKFTCLDGVALGYRVYLIEDACRGVDLAPGDVARALEDMQRAGVVVLKSRDIAAVL